MLIRERRVALTDTALKDALNRNPTSLVVAGAQVGDRPCGLVLPGFQTVSLDPPLVSICVPAASAVWKELRRAPRLGISVLGSAHADAVAALEGPEDHLDAEYVVRHGGALSVRGAPLVLAVLVVDDIAAGDHKIAVARVDGVEVADQPDRPLLGWRGSIASIAAATPVGV